MVPRTVLLFLADESQKYAVKIQPYLLLNLSLGVDCQIIIPALPVLFSFDFLHRYVLPTSIIPLELAGLG